MFLKQTFLSIFLSLGIIAGIFAQQKFTISGTVKDAKNGELVIGASIFNQNKITEGAVSNDYGFYSLTLPQGKYTITVSFLSYNIQTFEIDLNRNQTLNIALSDKIAVLNEVVIKARKDNHNITSTQMSVNRLDIKDVSKIPVLFGERDILKTIQLLPGIKSAGEGQTGFFVRGGAADQNLILLDEATVYNASHLLGFFSVFNSDAIKDVTIYKGGFPAQFGGRLSSVLDIKMNDGNNQKFSATGGIGLIASRLTLEAPIQKGKSSFIISGRRTYADLFLKLSSDSNLRSTFLYFYDLNLKANFQINDKNHIFLSGYFGRDNFGVLKAGTAWGNETGTLRWNHIFSNKFFSNTSLIFSDYNFNAQIKFDSVITNTDIIGANYNSLVRDWNLKQDFTYFSENNTLKFGFQSIHHSFSPGSVTKIDTFNVVAKSGLEKRYAFENALYVSDELPISSKLKAVVGARLSVFSLIGPGTFYKYNQNSRILDSTTYNAGQIFKTYGGLEPRLGLNYSIDSSTSLKANYTRTYQYVQLLSNTTTASPTDLWVPASLNVKPQIADQIALGFYKNFSDNKFEASVEVYYKTMQNQIDYKDFAQIEFNKYVENELVFGRGWSYGIEFFLKKKYGKFTGWAGYTWARTMRQFDAINNGNPFPARQDRTHDISLVGIYDISKKWSISATWVYSTGNAVTYPSGKYYIRGQLVDYYTERNGYRVPDYHRMDVGFNYQAKKTAKMESAWSFSVYNVYNRKNPYSITFEQNKDNANQIDAIRTTVFPFIPSFTWNFKF